MILSVSLSAPPLWLVAPFAGLLLMIATGPLFFAHFWHHHYRKVSIALGLLVGAYYVMAMNNWVLPVETLAEYVSFISLLTVLYVASGGIYLFVDVESKASANIIFLFLAALATNIIGTTGASVLFIRPFMRINRYRLKPYHIIFFIFMVSNVGGSLTPVGDPPLFMGFLKGVPFFWTMQHLFLPWLISIVLLLLVFYWFEHKNTALDDVDISSHYSGKIIMDGKQNLIWLALGVMSVFLDPNILDWLPSIDLHGKKISFVRELTQLAIAYVCYKKADKKALAANDFNFEPILEVAYLFFGIFLCMMPALQTLEAYAQAHRDTLHLTPAFVYFGSGIFSSVLDNAPTYLNVLALLLSGEGLSIQSVTDVQQFVAGEHYLSLAALSAGAVFFGAMTYIGNGPNFMVKAIAEQAGVKMPGFGAYITRYSVPILLPVLIVVCLLFFI